jgi:hypothetical protein
VMPIFITAFYSIRTTTASEVMSERQLHAIQKR